MNKYLIIFVSFILLNAQTINTIQLYSSKKEFFAIKNFLKIPKNLQKKCFVLKIKKFYTIRCFTNINTYKLKPIFPDLYLNKTYKWRLNHIIFPKKIKKNTKKINLPILSYLADKNFKNQNYLKALQIYKKIYKYNKNRQIAINIAYIMGLLSQKKEIINFAKKDENLLYAFSLGMLKSNPKELKPFLQKYIYLSKKGYLNIVLGYLYEKNNKKLALKEYKIAYQKNRFNPYFIYSLARGYEIDKQYKKALKLYKQIINCDDVICNISKKRYFILKVFLNEKSFYSY